MITPLLDSALFVKLHSRIKKDMLLSHIDHQVNLVYTEFDEFLSNFDKLLNHINQFRPFTIILGNFNARSKSCLPEDVTTHEGTHVGSLITMHGLQQLIISHPTHLLANSSSCIDLVFTDQPNLAVNRVAFIPLIIKLYTANPIL